MAKPSRSKKSQPKWHALAMSSLPPVSADRGADAAEDWDVLDLRSLIAESASTGRANDEQSGIRRVSDAELAELEKLTASSSLASMFPPAKVRKPSTPPSTQKNPELALIPEAPKGPPVPPDALAGLSTPALLPASLPAPPRASTGLSWGVMGSLLGAAATVAVIYGGALLPHVVVPSATPTTGQSTEAATVAVPRAAQPATRETLATAAVALGGGPRVAMLADEAKAPVAPAPAEKVVVEVSAKPSASAEIAPAKVPTSKSSVLDERAAELVTKPERREGVALVNTETAPLEVEASVSAVAAPETLAGVATAEIGAEEMPAAAEAQAVAPLAQIDDGAPVAETPASTDEAAPSAEVATAKEAALTETPAEQVASVDELMHRALTEDTAAAAKVPVKPLAQPASLPQTPSRTDVRNALTALMPRLRACAAGQTGMVTATIVVGGDGAVSTASLAGPFSGSPLGQCMTDVVKQAKFPAFERATFRVSYPFFIR